MDAMPRAGRREEGGRGGTGSRPEGPGYQGRPTRLRRSCPGVRGEWLGRWGGHLGTKQERHVEDAEG